MNPILTKLFSGLLEGSDQAMAQSDVKGLAEGPGQSFWKLLQGHLDQSDTGLVERASDGDVPGSSAGEWSNTLEFAEIGPKGLPEVILAEDQAVDQVDKGRSQRLELAFRNDPGKKDIVSWPAALKGLPVPITETASSNLKTWAGRLAAILGGPMEETSAIRLQASPPWQVASNKALEHQRGQGEKTDFWLGFEIDETIGLQFQAIARAEGSANEPTGPQSQSIPKVKAGHNVQEPAWNGLQNSAHAETAKPETVNTGTVQMSDSALLWLRIDATVLEAAPFVARSVNPEVAITDPGSESEYEPLLLSLVADEVWLQLGPAPMTQGKPDIIPAAPTPIAAPSVEPNTSEAWEGKARFTQDQKLSLFPGQGERPALFAQSAAAGDTEASSVDRGKKEQTASNVEHAAAEDVPRIAGNRPPKNLVKPGTKLAQISPLDPDQTESNEKSRTRPVQSMSNLMGVRSKEVAPGEPVTLKVAIGAAAGSSRGSGSEGAHLPFLAVQPREADLLIQALSHSGEKASTGNPALGVIRFDDNPGDPVFPNRNSELIPSGLHKGPVTLVVQGEPAAKIPTPQPFRMAQGQPAAPASPDLAVAGHIPRRADGSPAHRPDNLNLTGQDFQKNNIEPLSGKAQAERPDALLNQLPESAEAVEQGETIRFVRPAAGGRMAAEVGDPGPQLSIPAPGKSPGPSGILAQGQTRTAPMPQTPDLNRAFDQIVQSARIHLTDGRNEIQINLKPEYLGMVKIVVESVDQEVKAMLYIERPEVRQALESQIGQLQRSIQDQNVKIDRVEVHDFASQSQFDQTRNSGSGHAMRKENEGPVQGVRGGGGGSALNPDGQAHAKNRDFGYNTLELII